MVRGQGGTYAAAENAKCQEQNGRSAAICATPEFWHFCTWHLASRCSASTSTSPSAAPSAITATSTAACSTPSSRLRYVDALETEIRRARAGGRAADTIFFGGGTPSLLEPEEIGRLIAACRDGVRDAGRRRGHAGDQPRDLVARADGTVPGRRCQSNQFRGPVVQGAGVETAGTAAHRRPRDSRGRGSARRRDRQHQPRPDDVAAAAVAERLAGERRHADRRRSRARVALSAGAVSERHR